METKNDLPSNPTSNEIKFADLFDDLITAGRLSKEVKLSPKLTLTLATLSSEDYLDAESVYIANVPSVPADVVARVRMINHITYATTNINGRSIVDGKEAEMRENRKRLTEQLMRLSPVIIDKIYKEYSDLNVEQQKIYDNINTNIENF